MKSVAIIVPTIGNPNFGQCMESVYNQTYTNIRPYFVVDGDENFRPVNLQIQELGRTLKDMHIVKHNVGHGGWYGHRIYAAFSYLVNEDFVCFLDEDNWLNPDHVENMVSNLIANNLDWTHSLRNIYKKDGTFACQDDCESLGKWTIWHGKGRHVDTSSFLVKREVLVSVAGAWYGKWGADRQFFSALQNYYPNWNSTPNYSLNYRLDGNEGSVTEEFFQQGNKYMEDLYKGQLPWRSTPK